VCACVCEVVQMFVVCGVGAGCIAGTQVRCVWSSADLSVKWCRCVCVCGVCVCVCVWCVCMVWVLVA